MRNVQDVTRGGQSRVRKSQLREAIFDIMTMALAEQLIVMGWTPAVSRGRAL